ncbi:MAG TPA: cytochrome b N-terminal domain-containing protein [Methylomirabilota bacterium]|nr:cytochrome b N-terminal domain-containing protein [Methylomirabilota bacterium]
MKRWIDWLDQRTGIRKLAEEALFEKVPGGARWRYVWGSTLTFTLFIQLVTGVFLWMAYAPSAHTAWESVYFIQHQMWGGWLLRGIHHFTAHAMIVLLVLHLMQVVIDGAYKAPREVNFWFGLALLLLVLALSLTGYLLPWDQKGYWATQVATSIVAITPGIGPELQQLIVGGADYGHHTLTRFLALHAGVLPGAILVLLWAHICLFRRHGLTAKEPRRKPDTTFWPDQVLKDAVACLAVLATVLFFTLRHQGADLGAPAEPAEPYSAARPDWYFMFLFEFLKFFPGNTEIWGAIIIPTLILLLVAAMPFLGNWKLGHRFNLGLLFALIIGAASLTWLSYAKDAANEHFQHAARAAEREAERVMELASSPSGIPVSGARTLLRQDPLTQGPKLFAGHCASCHRYDGHDGMGGFHASAYIVQSGDTLAAIARGHFMTETALRQLNDLAAGEPDTGRPLLVHTPQSASDLKGFASREWIAGLLDPRHVASTNYFGATAFADGKMVKFVTEKIPADTPAERQQLESLIAAVSAEAALPLQSDMDARDAQIITRGREVIRDEIACIDCHQFREPDDLASAPDLTGYGSRDWLTAFIMNPAHPRFYGDRNDRMPEFGESEILTPEEVGLLADWLRGDWYRPLEP